MKVIEPSYEILNYTDLSLVEVAGRTCYKSEENITDESAIKFAENLVKRKHEAMIEHSSMTVKIICDRGVSHELVRHRISSFAQESTRYCNYSKDKFGNELTFIKPFFFEEGTYEYQQWELAMRHAEDCYLRLLEGGAQPQEARSVLPNSIKTEIVITANYREWRHFFKLRAVGTTGKPHPQMSQIAVPLLEDVKRIVPVIFDDLIVS